MMISISIDGKQQHKVVGMCNTWHVGQELSFAMYVLYYYEYWIYCMIHLFKVISILQIAD